jgi:hypothetical protein
MSFVRHSAISSTDRREVDQVTIDVLLTVSSWTFLIFYIQARDRDPLEGVEVEYAGTHVSTMAKRRF